MRSKCNLTKGFTWEALVHFDLLYLWCGKVVLYRNLFEEGLSVTQVFAVPVWTWMRWGFDERLERRKELAASTWDFAQISEHWAHVWESSQGGNKPVIVSEDQNKPDFSQLSLVVIKWLLGAGKKNAWIGGTLSEIWWGWAVMWLGAVPCGQLESLLPSYLRKVQALFPLLSIFLFVSCPKMLIN